MCHDMDQNHVKFLWDGYEMVKCHDAITYFWHDTKSDDMKVFPIR